jgi:hypothetical protein
MKTNLLIPLGLCVLGLPAFSLAQTNVSPGQPGAAATDSVAVREDRLNERYGDWNGFAGPRAGEREFTLGGSGLSNKDLDSSSGGVGASLGFYLNDTLMLAVRQTVNYANPSGGDSSYIGSTRVALDQHILASPSGRFRPFVGVNFGGVYGEDVTNTFAAGIEAGAKFYVQQRTFLYAMADYAWAFRNSDDATENFEDGGFQWSVGVGFNF